MGKWSTLLVGLMVAALPASSSYKLNNYSFGTGGGTAGSSSSTYSLNGTAGEQSVTTSTGTTYSGKSGDNNTQQAAVPGITLTNDTTRRYNKLKLVIDTQNNPSDTIYAVTISTDNFASDNRFVKSDNTVTSSLTYPTDYRTYSSWGSGSGIYVTGLLPSTTYYAKAKAMRGGYTETGYGPSSSVATVSPSLTFGVVSSAGGRSVSFSSPLTVGSVNTGVSTANLSFDTNGESGGDVAVEGLNAALKSAATLGTMNALSGDLAVASSGYGAQGTSATQSAGGALSVVSPFNVSGTNVGAIGTTFVKILTSSGWLTSGTASVVFKAKPSSTTPAATDYAETLTFIAYGSF